jgi:hypothetical protein
MAKFPETYATQTYSQPMWVPSHFTKTDFTGGLIKINFIAKLAKIPIITCHTKLFKCLE